MSNILLVHIYVYFFFSDFTAMSVLNATVFCLNNASLRNYFTLSPTRAFKTLLINSYTKSCILSCFSLINGFLSFINGIIFIIVILSFDVIMFLIYNMISSLFGITSFRNFLLLLNIDVIF